MMPNKDAAGGPNDDVPWYLRYGAKMLGVVGGGGKQNLNIIETWCQSHSYNLCFYSLYNKIIFVSQEMLEYTLVVIFRRLYIAQHIMHILSTF